ncbi:hypothetical protein [Halopelagius fulvigenes]|uniref:DUF8097 domain-containing protein n=1 Tax=Halopelagius fulvigenes TaxID=1198324 RepID=A0ABD5TX35_9EURY
MVSQRTRARFNVLAEAFSIPLEAYVRSRANDDDDEESSLNATWFLAGFAYRIANAWAYDRDVGGIRSSRLRQLALGVAFAALGFRSRDRPESEWRSFTLGGSLGYVCYRLRYGVFGPLSGDEE